MSNRLVKGEPGVTRRDTASKLRRDCFSSQVVAFGNRGFRNAMRPSPEWHTTHRVSPGFFSGRWAVPYFGKTRSLGQPRWMLQVIEGPMPSSQKIETRLISSDTSERFVGDVPLSCYQSSVGLRRFVPQRCIQGLCISY